MKECEEIGNDVLIPLITILKYQEKCELILKKDVKDSHLVLNKNGLCSYHEGLIEKPHSVVVELWLNRVIEVNIDSHELLRVNGEEVNGIEHNRVLDLNDDGERWEGDVLNNQPYGWGVLYDSENRMAYEGFRLEEVNVCCGRSYYPDNGVIEYEGMIFEGKRWGRGVQYDRSGNTVFGGEWINDEQLNKRVVLKEENQSIPSCIEELIVSNYRCKGQEWSVLDLSFMPSLRLLQVGHNCFEKVKEVKLIGFNQLEKVVIGANCITQCTNGLPGSLTPDRRFYLKNCEKLKEMKIGCYSFMDYSVCEIENLPSLEVIEMGELDKWSDNFCNASLELKSEIDGTK